MSELRENKLIVHPLTLYMEKVHGWYTFKFHGNQFQSGFPDLGAWHNRYDMRIIECKVIDNGDFSFTTAQQREFPRLIANGAKIWLIAAHDLLHDKVELDRAYRTLFNPPNLAYYLDPKTRRQLLR